MCTGPTSMVGSHSPCRRAAVTWEIALPGWRDRQHRPAAVGQFGERGERAHAAQRSLQRGVGKLLASGPKCLCLADCEDATGPYRQHQPGAGRGHRRHATRMAPRHGRAVRSRAQPVDAHPPTPPPVDGATRLARRGPRSDAGSPGGRSAPASNAGSSSAQEVHQRRLNDLGRRGQGCLVRGSLHRQVHRGLLEIGVLDLAQGAGDVVAAAAVELLHAL